MNLNNTQSIIVSGCAVMLLALLFGRMMFVGMGAIATEEQERMKLLEAPDSYSLMHLKAHSAFVFDIEKEKMLYALNADAQLPLASLTKIMTALIAVEEVGEDGVATVSKEAILKEGDHGFLVGERWRVQDLIDATLLTSSNDGAYALASVFATPQKDEQISRTAVLARVMNDKAKELELYQTFFIDEAGLDVNLDVSGAYGSARDVARLLAYVFKKHPTLMEATTRLLLTTYSLDGAVHNLENTNKFVETLPGIVASKTGTTDLAGGNLALVFEAGPMRPIAVVVLGSTADERFSDAEQLIFATLKHLQQ